jgi:hypothetical protein
VFENRVLRRIFGLKRDGVTGGWRKLHNEGLHDDIKITMKSLVGRMATASGIWPTPYIYTHFLTRLISKKE